MTLYILRHHSLTKLIFALLGIALLLGSQSISAEELMVDTSNRSAVIDFYNNHYCPGDNTNSEWNGDIAGGDAGSVSNAFEAATLERINFFRAMAGVSGDLALRSDWNQKCRKASLMMSANNDLSHSPSTTWTHYSSEGAEAAAMSNLSLGTTGPQSVRGQMQDAGSTNFAVGHRRWLLYRLATETGFGGVDPLKTYRQAACIWTIQENTQSAPVAAIPWPPEGFVPYTLIYDRWSFTYPGADFSSATVTVTKGSTNITVTLEAIQTGFGDNTLVWTLDDSDAGKRGVEVTYKINIDGVSGSGIPTSFEYFVTQIDAESNGDRSIIIKNGYQC